MNKKNNRKGFTIVELVIVIAVIAILATVLAPTFGNVIEKANDSKLLQNLKNEYTAYTIEAGADVKDDIFILLNTKYYQVENGAVVVDNNKPVEYTGEIPAGAVIFDAATDFVVHTFVDVAPADGQKDDKCDVCGLAAGATSHSN